MESKCFVSSRAPGKIGVLVLQSCALHYAVLVPKRDCFCFERKLLKVCKVNERGVSAFALRKISVLLVIKFDLDCISYPELLNTAVV